MIIDIQQKNVNTVKRSKLLLSVFGRENQDDTY